MPVRVIHRLHNNGLRSMPCNLYRLAFRDGIYCNGRGLWWAPRWRLNDSSIPVGPLDYLLVVCSTVISLQSSHASRFVDSVNRGSVIPRPPGRVVEDPGKCCARRVPGKMEGRLDRLSKVLWSGRRTIERFKGSLLSTLEYRSVVGSGKR